VAGVCMHIQAVPLFEFFKPSLLTEHPRKKLIHCLSASCSPVCSVRTRVRPAGAGKRGKGVVRGTRCDRASVPARAGVCPAVLGPARHFTGYFPRQPGVSPTPDKSVSNRLAHRLRARRPVFCHVLPAGRVKGDFCFFAQGPICQPV